MQATGNLPASLILRGRRPHAELQTKNGILNHENLIFDELIADKKYQFVYSFTPSPIKGATGSNGCPIAIT